MWGLHDVWGKPLPPRVFSDGRDQKEVVDEILQEFDDHDLVLFRGAVGSGKSIIGVTVAGVLGRGLINVPVKPLQEQYCRDYGARLKILLQGKKLKIRSILGRDNFTCQFKPKFKCGFKKLPCTAVLPKGVSRLDIASHCPYWSPIYRRKSERLKKILDADILEYPGIKGKCFIYRRKAGCGYYDQSLAYKEADVIIYNNAKWIIDTVIGRKPLVDVEIIDEADMFLDQLTLRTSVSAKTLTGLLDGAEFNKEEKEAFIHAVNGVKKDLVEFISKVAEKVASPLNMECEELLKRIIELAELADSEYATGIRIRLMNILNYGESAGFFREGDRLVLFVPEPAIVFRSIRENSSSKMLLMSATMHSPQVFARVFKCDDFGWVEGETKFPGRIYPRRTGKEIRVGWKSWNTRRFREAYWKVLDHILKLAERPTLVQIHSYKYLPEKAEEISALSENIPTQDFVRSIDQDRSISSFRNGGKGILFSTKTDRGIDLPDGMCRSIVLLKYPFPDLSDPIFQIMRARLGPDVFWSYYHDIASRDFIQQLGRGLRNEDDWIELWSPDKKVHLELRKRF